MACTSTPQAGWTAHSKYPSGTPISPFQIPTHLVRSGVPPGQTFDYVVPVNSSGQHGTYWAHAHSYVRRSTHSLVPPRLTFHRANMSTGFALPSYCIPPTRLTSTTRSSPSSSAIGITKNTLHCCQATSACQTPQERSPYQVISISAAHVFLISIVQIRA